MSLNLRFTFLCIYMCIKKLNNVDSNNGIQISQNYYAKEIESTVDIHRKNTVKERKMLIKSPHEGKRAAE